MSIIWIICCELRAAEDRPGIFANGWNKKMVHSDTVASNRKRCSLVGRRLAVVVVGRGMWLTKGRDTGSLAVETVAREFADLMTIVAEKQFTCVLPNLLRC